MTNDFRTQWRPDGLATVVANRDNRTSFAQLDDASARLAGMLRRRGLIPGDRLAVLMENRPDYFVVAWAARRSGLRIVPINWHLNREEAAYVVDNSDAKALIVSPHLASLGEEVLDRASQVQVRLVLGDADMGRFESLDRALSSSTPLAPEAMVEGAFMFYSSGTTGAPKGILRAMPDVPFGTPNGIEVLQQSLYGFDADSVYLCPAPLYHAAPLGWSMGTQALGGAVVLMETFDAEAVLAAIERHRVTHAQFVPTHFVRLLRLPEEVKRRYDLSSLRMAVHAAAPCSVEVKDAMIAWWGKIIHEYYAGSEGGGFVVIGPQEWLGHKGSVGRSIRSPIHIVDEGGAERPAGEIGLVYFEGADRFDYHKAPEKTAEFFNAAGWGTLGDMGWLDADGYLYLSDRKSHMIISGGVNIYPQEIEAALMQHPDIADIAVIGVPNAEFGEEVKAVVELRRHATQSEAITASILAFGSERLAKFKLPRSVDYVDQLPRLPNGKLMKRELRAAYWGDAARVRI